MPDHRRHRGAHPQDELLFAPTQRPALRRAVHDLSWLWSRNYAVQSSLKLVGDRYRLTDRQRLAISRAACSDQQLSHWQASCRTRTALADQVVVLDGFNIIITVEAALSGGVLIYCRDGCVRDLSSVHGSYRQIDETEAALQLIGNWLQQGEPAAVHWLLDQPVSNSGRLAQQIRKLAANNAWPWTVEVVMNPDKAIKESGMIAITSDSNVLDGVSTWINLCSELFACESTSLWRVDLREAEVDLHSALTP